MGVSIAGMSPQVSLIIQSNSALCSHILHMEHLGITEEGTPPWVLRPGLPTISHQVSVINFLHVLRDFIHQMTNSHMRMPPSIQVIGERL